LTEFANQPQAKASWIRRVWEGDAADVATWRLYGEVLRLWRTCRIESAAAIGAVSASRRRVCCAPCRQFRMRSSLKPRKR
jgi:hypothetical protein